MGNKFTLDISEPIYKVYPNAVVCYLKAKPSNKIEKILLDHLYPRYVNTSEYWNVCNTWFKGVAVLKEGDTYDEEMGKKIAYFKCKRQINKAWQLFLLNLTNKMRNNLSEVIKMYDTTVDRIEDLDNEIIKNTRT